MIIIKKKNLLFEFELVHLSSASLVRCIMGGSEAKSEVVTQ